MFILHSSNKTENLLAHLQAVLTTAPLSSPFAEELFLIHSQGMERWLSQQLAAHFKVWANFKFLFPVKFFNTLSERLHAETTNADFERHLLLWHIEALLRDIDQQPVYQPLQAFLGDGDALKRYQLARQLTQMFDQYQILRLDLLDSWRQNVYQYHTPAEYWQSSLWRSLLEKIGSSHRGSLWRTAIDKLQQTPPGELSDSLPERISVFGINSMPPLLLAYLNALALHCDVHLYWLNPAQEYWADLPNKRQQRAGVDWGNHPLLVKLGQQGREFQQLLLEQAEFSFEPSSFEATTASNNLQQLQNDILSNCHDARVFNSDNSISVHCCHSRLREVQVLKNLLLETLETQPDLQLRDLVVMAPDIQHYAPFISAVFADLPHAIADRSLGVTSAGMNILQTFLQLISSRFGWQNVLDLLEQPLVHTSFGLEATELNSIRYWVADTQIRWGQSAAHRQALDLPAFAANTWQAGLERLFVGYAVGDCDQFVDGVLPYADIEGSACLALGGLNDFLQLLFQAAAETNTTKTMQQWRDWLGFYINRLLQQAPMAEKQLLLDLLADMSEIADRHQQDLPLTVIQHWLQQRIDESQSSQGFLRGQLTFCAMLPMRSIPFQVIALLGMNDGEFPHSQRSPSFDLLSAHPRLGDRSRRSDDRYQFLEILLSARRQLIMTYIGRSQRDNSPLPPSVIVSELLETLQQQYQWQNLVVEHPLHGFSHRYFDQSDSRLFSYAASDFAIAARLQQAASLVTPWWQGRLPMQPKPLLDVADLLHFYAHPQRFFLRLHGVQIPRMTATEEQREPFLPDNLTLYQLQQQSISQWLNGEEPDLAHIQAAGRWPCAAVGELLWQRQLTPLHEFVEKIRALQPGNPLPAINIDIICDNMRLQGKLANVYENCSLFYRYSRLKGRDFITAWLHHVLINQQKAQTTHLLSSDQHLIFVPEQVDTVYLPRLLEIFLQGQLQPDVFFTEAAFCYLQNAQADNALSKVIDSVVKNINDGYEPELTYVLQNRDLSSVFNQDFADICNHLLLAAWNNTNAD